MAAAATVIPIGYRHYKALVTRLAEQYRVDPLLAMAVVWKESSFNTDAFRYEPDFWNRYLKNNPKYRHLNPRRVSSSYGLMQVMYCRVQEDKLATNDAWEPELLFVPENGVAVGCEFLRELLDWAAPLEMKAQAAGRNVSAEFIALAAYNGGRGGNDPTKNWPLRNGAYARDVLAKRDILKQQ